MFFDEKLSKTTEPYYFETGLYSSVTDIVKTTKTLVKERNNHRDTCIRTKVNRVAEKIKCIWPLKNLVEQLVVQTCDIY